MVGATYTVCFFWESTPLKNQHGPQQNISANWNLEAPNLQQHPFFFEGFPCWSLLGCKSCHEQNMWYPWDGTLDNQPHIHLIQWVKHIHGFYGCFFKHVIHGWRSYSDLTSYLIEPEIFILQRTEIVTLNEENLFYKTSTTLPKTNIALKNDGF